MPAGLSLLPSDAEISRAIAVIGLSGRFPGAPDREALWELLLEGRDGVTEAPPGRPWFRELYGPVVGTPGHLVSTRGGFLTGLDTFDAGFFSLPLSLPTRSAASTRRYGCSWKSPVRRSGMQVSRCRGAAVVAASSWVACTPTTGSAPAPRRPGPRLPLRPGRRGPGRHLRAPGVPAGPARPHPHGGHRVLVLTERRVPGLPGDALGWVRAGAGRGRQPHPDSVRQHPLRRGGLAEPGRALQVRR